MFVVRVGVRYAADGLAGAVLIAIVRIRGRVSRAMAVISALACQLIAVLSPVELIGWIE